MYVDTAGYIFSSWSKLLIHYAVIRKSASFEQFELCKVLFNYRNVCSNKPI